MRFFLLFVVFLSASNAFAQSPWGFGVNSGISSNQLLTDSELSIPEQNITGYTHGFTVERRLTKGMALQMGLQYNWRQGGLLKHINPSQTWTNARYSLPFPPQEPILADLPRLVEQNTKYIYNYSTLELPVGLLLRASANAQGLSFYAVLPQLSVQLPLKATGSIINSYYNKPIGGIDIAKEMPKAIFTGGFSLGAYYALPHQMGFRLEFFASRSLNDLAINDKDRWLKNYQVNNPSDPNDDVIDWIEDNQKLSQVILGAKLHFCFGNWMGAPSK